MSDRPPAFLERLFRAAIGAADPQVCVPSFLPAPPKGRTVVVGAGKAAAAMARAVEDHWPGALSGIVVTPYGHRVATDRIVVLEAAHPVPDAAGMAAASDIRAALRDLTGDDLVLFLVSGGGSALLVDPLPPLTLEDKQAVNRDLLRSGASIGEMNCVRRHLSAIKGGRLAALCHPARCVTLAISDVPGDRPGDIASGPTVGDPTTRADALAIAMKYAVALPPSARTILADPLCESIKPDDRRLGRTEFHLVATPLMALDRAARLAHEENVSTRILGDAIEGEARAVARAMAETALETARRGGRCVLLSGGETTVTVRGTGRGGRNVEFLLALAIALEDHPGVYALAGDTDGVDGREPVAGAWIGPDTMTRARLAGLDPQAFLHDNDAHSFFEALGQQVVTGPTLTNVNDFRAIAVGFDDD